MKRKGKGIQIVVNIYCFSRPYLTQIMVCSMHLCCISYLPKSTFLTFFSQLDHKIWDNLSKLPKWSRKGSKAWCKYLPPKILRNKFHLNFSPTFRIVEFALFFLLHRHFLHSRSSDSIPTKFPILKISMIMHILIFFFFRINLASCVCAGILKRQHKTAFLRFADNYFPHLLNACRVTSQKTFSNTNTIWTFTPH